MQVVIAAPVLAVAAKAIGSLKVRQLLVLQNDELVSDLARSIIGQAAEEHQARAATALVLEEGERKAAEGAGAGK